MLREGERAAIEWEVSLWRRNQARYQRGIEITNAQLAAVLPHGRCFRALEAPVRAVCDADKPVAYEKRAADGGLRRPGLADDLDFGEICS